MTTWGGDQEGGNGFKGRRQRGVNGGRSEGGKGWGPAFERRPAHKSPDFGPTRKSAISGDIVEEIRKAGLPDLVRTS